MLADEAVYKLNSENFALNQHEAYAGYAIYEKSDLLDARYKWEFQHFYVFLGVHEVRPKFLIVKIILNYLSFV